ncbi:MAG: nucleoside-diphosphate sugar epimerase/dehydratase, partial [Candidatus Limnocylindrales bacterium]
MALRLAMMAADALSAFGLFVAVSLFRFGPHWAGPWNAAAGVNPWLAALVYSAIWMTTLWLTDLYRLRARWTYHRELIDIFRAALLIALAAFSALFIFHLGDVSRLFLLELFAAQVVVTMGARIVIRTTLRLARAHGYSARFILIVGTGAPARAFAARIERRRDLGLRVIGHLAEGPEAPPQVGPNQVLGRLEDIEAILHAQAVDEVAICLLATSIGLVEPIARLCEEEGKIVRIPVDEVAGLTLPGGRLEDFDGLAVLSLVYGPDRIISLVIKRAVDIAGAAVGLV